MSNKFNKQMESLWIEISPGHRLLGAHSQGKSSSLEKILDRTTLQRKG